MPSLADIEDVEELDNLYADKTIIYVEGDDDEAVFNDLVGPNMGDRLEFKVPKALGSGYHMVCARVAAEREKNPKIHGLLDGEAAASFGQFGALLQSQSIFFTLQEASFSGVLFLSVHELENMVLCHANVAEFLTQNVTFSGIGQKSAADLEAELMTLARRFYLLAILKVAAGHIHRAGTSCKQVDYHSGRFQSDESILTILQALKPKVIDEGVAWKDFLKEVVAFLRQARIHFTAQELNAEARNREIVRLADGKGLLKKVRGKYNGVPAWEGLLAERLKRSDYAAEFRTALEAATGCS